jgi:hypothetical protein
MIILLAISVGRFLVSGVDELLLAAIKRRQPPND